MIRLVTYLPSKPTSVTTVLTAIICLLALTVRSPIAVGDQYQPDIWPRIDSPIRPDASMETAINDLLRSMTLQQKVGQMLQPELRHVTAEDIKRFHIGSILNGAGSYPNGNKRATVDDWVALADRFYHASMDTSGGGIAIPLVWGTDAVHGHNNLIGATLFPHNIGLGATRNPALVRQVAAATAVEVAVSGIDWVFAPSVAVARNDRWGRTFESYSEDPQLVKAYAGSMVEGLQGSAGSQYLFSDSRVIATAKHFIGDGGTREGTDRGDNAADEQQLFDIHGQGYISALASGVQTIMASFNSWQGKKLHGHHYLLTRILKQRMGFDGFVIGDWDGHALVEGCSPTSCPHAINAGLDVLMTPNADWQSLYHNTVQQVEAGEIDMSRIDDAVRRILRVKMRAGVFTAGVPSRRPLSGHSELIGSTEHRALARRAVRESLVLLKNKHNLLPLSRKLKVLVAGDGADNIGKQAGGWTLSWQGQDNRNADFTGATSIYAGIQRIVNDAGGSAVLSVDGRFSDRPDVAIVVYGEEPYAEMHGDIRHLAYQWNSGRDAQLLRRLKSQGIAVVSVFLTGRPLWINRELNASDAFVVAWLPGSEGAGIADVLFRDRLGGINHDFVGRLAFSWPAQPDQDSLNTGDEAYDPLFAYGYGLRAGAKDSLSDSLPEDASAIADLLTKIRSPTLFASRPEPPWSLFIGDKEDWQIAVTEPAATTRNGSNLRVGTTDRNSQQSALQATWSGQSAAILYLQDPGNPHDLQQMLDERTSLYIELRVDRPPTDGVLLRMGCGYPCLGKIDIASRLRAMPRGSWQGLSVDLQCFAASGTDFSKIVTPFALLTGGALTLSVAKVELRAQTAGEADIRCSELNP